MRRLFLLTLLTGAALAAPAHAATVSSDGTTLSIAAGPGERNAVTVTLAETLIAPSFFIVRDAATPPVAGRGCVQGFDPGTVTCTSTGITRAVADLGDQPDTYSDASPLSDTITTLDGQADAVSCGPGRDSVRAEVLDTLELGCESVDYGPPGRVGKLRSITGGGKFVPVPGQHGARIDRRLLDDVLYLVRRYKVRVGDGYSLHGNHEPLGEHPLGLAADLYPGPGGSWDNVDRLARWAEPRQNHPRLPLRWVGYNGDYNHGRGNHLHLSWMHSKGRPGHPVRTVRVWKVSSAR